MTFLIFLIAVACSAQTLIDLRTQTKDVDFSGAVSTRPAKVGSSLPAACVTGELFFNTSAPAGINLYGCTSTNTWSVQSNGSSLAPGTGTTIGGTPSQPVVNVDPTVVPYLGANNAFSGLNNMSQQVIVKATAYTMTTADWNVICDTSTAGTGLTVKLPPSPTTGLVQTIYNSGQFTCTVDGNGRNIEGAAANADLISAKQAMVLQYSGAEWKILARSGTSGASLGTNARVVPFPWSNVNLNLTHPFAGHQVFVARFSVGASAVLRKLITNIQATNGNDFLAFALYDNSCSTVLAQTAPLQVSSTGTNAFSWAAPYPLTAGTYYLAVTSDGTSIRGYSSGGSSGIESSIANGGSVVAVGTAANASTGTSGSLAFPASCGALTGQPSNDYVWYAELQN